MRSEEAKELDELLRVGLASYSAAEPRWGMGERILRSVLEQKQSRRAAWWLWAAGALAMASVLMAMVLTLTHPKTVTAPTMATTAPATQSVDASHPETTEGQKVAATPRKHASSMAVSQVRTTTQQKVNDDFLFPASQMLTQEEALVVQVVEMRPAEVSTALQEAKTRSLEPVRVAAIHIEPLQTDGDRQEE